MSNITNPAPGVVSWADPETVDARAIAQAALGAAMPFVESPLALMPDAHVGKGSTIGSVIATNGALIPAAVGVDLGCGMAAARMPYGADALPDNLDGLFRAIAQTIPAGQPSRSKKGRGSHAEPAEAGSQLVERASSRIAEVQKPSRTLRQLGTLGGGNHFVEVCTDEDDRVWVVLHSGSRGVGNKVAQFHIRRAGATLAKYFVELPDPDLAYLVENTAEFSEYVQDMLWAQDYAAQNRRLMMDAALGALGSAVGLVVEPEQMINCHHNYCQQEHHHGKNLWVTRKGAIRARSGDWGIIPGSMATGSFIVTGKGNAASYHSASHGAGRAMSRTQARKSLNGLASQMEGITWNDDPQGLLDEHPAAYKDLDAVMARQSDLVDIRFRLMPILNYKGS